jgi:hypothetical protein
MKLAAFYLLRYPFNSLENTFFKEYLSEIPFWQNNPSESPGDFETNKL